MKLGKLIEDIDVSHIEGPLSVDITGVACDSRQVESGNLFVAVKGTANDGREFIPEALSRGASAIVSEASPIYSIAVAAQVIIEITILAR